MGQHFVAFALQHVETLFLGPGDVMYRQPGILRRWSYAVVYPWCSGKFGQGELFGVWVRSPQPGCVGQFL